MIVGLNRRAFTGAARASALFAFSLILALTTFSFAYGDFIPVTKSKVLGVGRIQSALPETPVTPESKFALPAPESVPEQQVSELVAPIAREIAPVAYMSTTPAAGWKSTMATNYATSGPDDFEHGDGFLNCSTATGAITTTTSMGVAHKSLPLGTMIEIYCPATGLSCIAEVNDRGPYGGYWGTQPDTFDLQMGVTAALGDNYGWYEIHYRIL
jgi:hypothetical protein